MNRLAIILMLTVACGGTRSRDTETPTTPTPIEALRERAAAAPQDARLQREVAEAEMFWVGGDAESVIPALDRALALSPEDASLHLMRAWMLRERGDYAQMQDSTLAAIEAARRGGDPAGPFVIEAALRLDAADLTAGAEARMIPVLDALLEDPRGLGEPAVRAAILERLRIAARRGDQGTLERSLARLGCVSDWRAAGPFGPLPMTTFDRTLAAEGAGPLADEYDLGVARGTHETFDAESRRCNVVVRGEETSAGVSIAEAFVDVPADRAGSTVLSVLTGSSYTVSIDGNEVHRVDRRERLQPRQHFVPLTLTEGRHEIELKIAPAPASFELVLSALGDRGASWDPTLGLEPPEPTRDFEHALYASILLSRGEGVRARAAFGPLADEARPAFPLTIYRRVVGSTPYMDSSERSALDRRLLRRTNELDPAMVAVALDAVGLEQGGPERAQALAALAERFPDAPIVQYAWAGELRGRDQITDAVAVIERLRDRLPDSCTPVRELAGLYRSQGRVADANALVERQMECSADSRARLNLAYRQHEFDAAREELERLRPQLEDDDILRLERSLALATGQMSRADALLDQLQADEPMNSERVVQQVDERLAAGDRRGAVRVLETAMAEDPDLVSGLRGLRRDLTGESEFEPWRVDGLEMIARYENGETQHPDAGQVLVFDYMVTRVYDDGSARHLVHQIFRVQSEESVERLGQIALGGDLLTLRTIKPDGRQLEPESIAGLDSIPLTELAIGDYVEYELVRSEGPQYNGGYMSAGWSFDGSEQPFAFSQMVALVPASMQVVSEEIGGTPEPTEEREGDLRVLRWTMEHVPSRPAEPNAVPVPPYQPTLRFAVSASHEVQFAAIREALLGADPIYEPHRALAQRLASQGAGDESGDAAIAAIARWVRDEIEPAGFSGIAPQMVSSKRGDHARVARYLLSLAGFDARIALARRFGGYEPSAIPRPAAYAAPLVLIRREGQPDRYLQLGNRYAPWDYIAPNLRGMEAWVVVGGPVERVAVSDGAAQDRREVLVDVTPDGDALRVSVVERSHGMGALQWRQNLERIPEADLERVLNEAYVSRVLPGGEMISVELSGQAEPDEPFTIAYTVRTRAFGRAMGNRWMIPPFMPADASGLVALSSRTTSMGVGRIDSELLVRVHGTADIPSVQDANVSGQGVSYRRNATRSGDVLEVTHELHVERRIVPVSDYADFARVIRQVSELERAETPVQFR